MMILSRKPAKVKITLESRLGSICRSRTEAMQKKIKNVTGGRNSKQKRNAAGSSEKV